LFYSFDSYSSLIFLKVNFICSLKEENSKTRKKKKGPRREEGVGENQHIAYGRIVRNGKTYSISCFPVRKRNEYVWMTEKMQIADQENEENQRKASDRST